MRRSPDTTSNHHLSGLLGDRGVGGCIYCFLFLLGVAISSLHSVPSHAQELIFPKFGTLVEPRPVRSNPPPRVKRLTEQTLEELEAEQAPYANSTDDKSNPWIISPIKEDLQRIIRGGRSSNNPLELLRRPKEPPKPLKAIPFTDLPTLDITDSRSSAFQNPLAIPNPVGAEPVFRPQEDDDIAPTRDLPSPVEELQHSPINIQNQQQDRSVIPLSAPPIETFGDLGIQSFAGPDLYEGMRPDSKTVFPMWWDELVVNADRSSTNLWNVGINDLIVYFLKHSPRLKAIQLVRESSQPAIPASIAEFDPTVFVETNFIRLNDPIGNTLTTGGSGRFLDNNWTSRAGLRKKFRSGGSLEAFQRYGIQTNNSEFFVPNQQGTAYLSLNFTQPLLNGRGALYNESLIAIATLENNVAGNVAEEKIQNELLELAELYWRLYSFRAIWIQKQKNVQRAESVYNELRGREGFDVSRTQLFRAKAAVETRKAELIMAQNDVRNVEAKLSALLGIDIKFQRFQYIPNFVPNLHFPSIKVGDAFVSALSNRPEILQCAKQAEIAAMRANRSRHELLPVLDFLVGTYVSGLDENYEFIDAFGRQFSDGAPGYSAGLNFEIPLHRRAAKARLERDETRWQAITSEFESKILEVQSEVDIAVRAVETAYRTLVARSVAMESAKQEMNAQRERLKLTLNDGDNIGNTLNFLLDAQDRLAQQENLLAQAQADYMVSWVAVKKAMGTLVVVESGN